VRIVRTGANRMADGGFVTINHVIFSVISGHRIGFRTNG
jgi:hypothetical protein